MEPIVTFGLAFLGYALLAADVARRAWGRRGRALIAATALVVSSHVALVWILRFGGSLSAALAKGWAGFLVFHAALGLIVAAPLAREPWRTRLVFAAFPVVTAGALGAAFRYDYVTLLRIPLLAVFGAAVALIATGARRRHGSGSSPRPGPAAPGAPGAGGSTRP